MVPRLRFAPSPTGYLHVGGARTALFNWLYARRHGGVFILRIEDTDVERSSDEMVTGILDGLRWLGLDWDEGPEVDGPHAPYFQSQRLDKYRAAAERLVAEGRAFVDEGAIRFRIPEGTTRFADLVHGPIEFDNANIEPFVILRSDRHPTYHLSVVVDDIDMAITHVVRGDDHISNTPKQVLLYQAFGAATPAFAHVPLIMGPDKKRLSKRHGATSVMEYERQGYIPEGMSNFLALLGWSPGGNDELFTTSELVERFTLEGISGGNAVFNTEKLDWFNHQHLLRLPDEELLTRLAPLLESAGLWRQSLTGDGLRVDAEGAGAAQAARETADRVCRGVAAVPEGPRQLRCRRRQQAPFRARHAGPHRGARSDAWRRPVRRGRARAAAARAGRVARRQGRDADPRDAYRHDWPDGQSRTLRNAGVAGS